MNNYFLHGFYKGAQVEQVSETAIPGQEFQSQPEDKDTKVTCLSNCMYSQNPEKQCTLDSISMSMDEKTAALVCGQHSPQEVMHEGN